MSYPNITSGVMALWQQRLAAHALSCCAALYGLEM